MGIKPKILLATPTARAKDYCLKDWLKKIKSLSYLNYDILIVDNSPEQNYYKHIQKLLGKSKKRKHEVIRYTPPNSNKSLQEIMCDCNNLIRDYVLKNDYEYLFSLESDVFPSNNIIQRLLAARADVATAYYFIGTNHDSFLLTRDLEPFGRNVFDFDKSIEQAFIDFDGINKKAYQTGLGCILISRKVLKSIPFRVDKTNPSTHADTFFHEDLRNANVNVVGIDVICEHRNNAVFWEKIK